MITVIRVTEVSLIPLYSDQTSVPTVSSFIRQHSLDPDTWKNLQAFLDNLAYLLFGIVEPRLGSKVDDSPIKVKGYSAFMMTGPTLS